jgi:hypothetical protein
VGRSLKSDDHFPLNNEFFTQKRILRLTLSNRPEIIQKSGMIVHIYCRCLSECFVMSCVGGRWTDRLSSMGKDRNTKQGQKHGAVRNRIQETSTPNRRLGLSRKTQIKDFEFRTERARKIDFEMWNSRNKNAFWRSSECKN